MQKVINIAYALVLILSSVACKRTMNASDYMHFMNEKQNGLKKTIEVDGFQYCMQYKPYDYIILMENKGRADGGDIEKRKKELTGTAWFNISIKRSNNAVTPLRYGLSSLDEYNTRLNYYLNNAQKDIWLLYGADTIHPVSYLFENNYNLTPQETMVVGFYLPEGDHYPMKNMQLAYNDVIFKNGIIKATYSEQVLKNIPNLSY